MSVVNYARIISYHDHHHRQCHRRHYISSSDKNKNRTGANRIFTNGKTSTVVEGGNLSARKIWGDSISKLIPFYNNNAIYNLQ